MLQVLIDLSNTAQLDNMPRWHPLKEQSESIHHGRGHPPHGGGGGSGGQGSHGGQGGPGGSGEPGGTGGQPNSEQSPKTSVIKSRSHGIFPDPAKGSLHRLLLFTTQHFFVIYQKGSFTR